MQRAPHPPGLDQRARVPERVVEVGAAERRRHGYRRSGPHPTSTGHGFRRAGTPRLNRVLSGLVQVLRANRHPSPGIGDLGRGIHGRHHNMTCRHVSVPAGRGMMESCPACTTRPPRRSSPESTLYIDDAALTEFEDNGIEIDERRTGRGAGPARGRRHADIPRRHAVRRPVPAVNDLGAPRREHGTYVVLLYRMAWSMRRRTPCPPGDAAREVAEAATLRTAGRHRRVRRPAGRRSRGGATLAAPPGRATAPAASPTATVRLDPAGHHRGRRRGRVPAVPAEQAQQGTRGSRTGPSRHRRRRHGLRRGARRPRPRRPNSPVPRPEEAQQEYARALDLYENAKTAAARSSGRASCSR